MHDTEKNRSTPRHVARGNRMLPMALVCVLAIGAWELARQYAGEAFAQIADHRQPRVLPDVAMQRKEMLEEQRKTNAKLDELVNLFKSGQARVTVETDKKPNDTRKGTGRVQILPPAPVVR